MPKNPEDCPSPLGCLGDRCGLCARERDTPPVQLWKPPEQVIKRASLEQAKQKYRRLEACMMLLRRNIESEDLKRAQWLFNELLGILHKEEA